MNLRLQVLVLSLLLLSTTTNVLGQRVKVNDYLRIRYLTVNEGLTNNKVNDITQDKTGYMWFGTDEGLNRFDGYEIKSYQHDKFDSTTLTSNVIYTLFCDSRNILWIGLRYGLNIYGTKGNTFVELKYEGTTLNDIRDIKEDDEGRVWICAEQGLYYYDYDQGLLQSFEVINSFLQYDPIHSFHQDSKGNKWIGTTDHGLFMLKDDAQPTHIPQSRDYRIEYISEDHQGSIWYGTFNNHLYEIKQGSDVPIQHVLDHNDSFPSRVRSMKVDRSGNLWVGSRRGLYMKKNGDPQFCLMARNDMSARLAHNSIFSVFIDNYDILWMGTFSGGVNHADLNQKKFMTLQRRSDSLPGLNNDMVFELKEDGDKILIGTQFGGLNIWNRSNGQVDYHLSNVNKQSDVGINIHAISIDKSGKYWIATYDAGLICYNPVSSRYEKILPKAAECGLNSDHVYAVLIDSKQRLWVGTDSGLCYGDKECMTCFEEYDITHSGVVINIVEDSNGRIWVCSTEGGVFQFDNDSEKLRQVSAQDISRTIYVVFEDSQKNIWMGGHENGLILWTDEKIQRFTAKDGIPNNTVLGILEDDHNNLWCSTSKGLIRIRDAVSDRKVVAEKVRVYDVSDGLKSNQFVRSSALKSKTGTMYFGSIKGVTYFEPNDIFDNSLFPDVTLTRLKLSNQEVQPNREVNNRVVLRQDIDRVKEIVIDHSDDYLTLEFASLHYANPELHRYQYKLENYDKEWISATADRRYATYTNLPGGMYTFKVRGTNYDGVWSQQTKELDIYVNPPWYQLWWVRICVLIFLIGLVLSVIRMRTRFLIRQKALLRIEVERRTLLIQRQHKEIEAKNAELIDTIEQLKNAQFKLVQSEKLSSLGQLTAGIAHEINNPANFIMGGLEGLEVDLERIREYVGDEMKKLSEMRAMLSSNSGIDLTEKQKKLLEIDHERLLLFEKTNERMGNMIHAIKVGATRTVDIVKSLRVFSRIDETLFTPSDIHKSLEDTLLLLKHKLKNRIHVIKQYGDLPLIECNPGKLSQVFMNLLTNAIQAIEEKGVIEIKTEMLSENDVRISISDTGKGIPFESRGSIFDPFYTTKEVGEGTGLGLSISKGIIDDHNGNIYFEPNGNQGTIFIIELPVKNMVKTKNSEIKERNPA